MVGEMVKDGVQEGAVGLRAGGGGVGTGVAMGVVKVATAR